MQSFFDKCYQTPLWLKEKSWFHINSSRRNFLKSAGGAVAIASTSINTFAANTLAKNSLTESQIADQQWRTKPLWQTLNAVLDHLLPSSKTGPSAADIHALQYLYNVVMLQPTSDTEISFIKKGVGWLNGYSQSQLSKLFIDLNFTQKETILHGISNSQAGENWLSTLLSYIFEAMLTPEIYGGNPNHIGEKWLDHQAGFPLPKIGTRYYELPGAYRISDKIDPQALKIKNIPTPRTIRKTKA
ncbi:MAG: gluconate 2-dehydrogenase subunit 3 family protein [Alteromonadaceae bacterium]|nr:gluconate 2-dehydrogenase subunit 3 family protein [Alteromonadaceae bacterium]